MIDIPLFKTTYPDAIHPSAVISPGAEIAKNVGIGAFAVIGPKVKLSEGVRVGAHAVVDGRTTIGPRTRISPFASIGSIPQDLKYHGEDAELIIGAENQFREYCNVSIGTEGGGGKTVIGSRNLFMVYTHIAHDCVIGDDCIAANGVAMAGHVHVGDRAVLGGLSAIHQFCRIGTMAMIAGGAMVSQDVPPFTMVHGNRAVPNGLNAIGIKRAGLGTEGLAGIKNMYRLLYSENLTVEDAVTLILAEVPAAPWRDVFVEFLRKSERGVCR